MEHALKSLEKEVDVIKMIRSRRFVHLALRHLLDSTVRKELKAKSKCAQIGITEPRSENYHSGDAKSENQL